MGSRSCQGKRRKNLRVPAFQVASMLLKINETECSFTQMTFTTVARTISKNKAGNGYSCWIFTTTLDSCIFAEPDMKCRPTHPKTTKRCKSCTDKKWCQTNSARITTTNRLKKLWLRNSHRSTKNPQVAIAAANCQIRGIWSKADRCHFTCHPLTEPEISCMNQVRGRARQGPQGTTTSSHVVSLD